MTHYKEVTNGHIVDRNPPLDIGKFSSTYADIIVSSLGPMDKLGSVLEIGCAVGGVCIEMAKHFKSVTGVDVDGEMIKAAKEMLLNGSERVTRKVRSYSAILQDSDLFSPTEPHSMDASRVDLNRLPRMRCNEPKHWAFTANLECSAL